MFRAEPKLRFWRNWRNWRNWFRHRCKFPKLAKVPKPGENSETWRNLRNLAKVPKPRLSRVILLIGYHIYRFSHGDIFFVHIQVMCIYTTRNALYCKETFPIFLQLFSFSQLQDNKLLL